MGERRGTKGLELWCRRMTEGYPGVKIDNMTTSWRDGLAFCAIIHHFRPDLIDFSTLKKNDVYYNNDLAFTVAEKYLGIPALLEAADMVQYDVPDRLSILTYLSQFYRAFVASQGTSPSRTVPKRPASASDRGIVSPASTSPPTKMAVKSGGMPRRDPCAKCGLPVFIAERLSVGKLLYHRTCFRCARCNSQLTLANYYETETQNQFCCETCPDEETKNEKPKIEVKSIVARSLSDEEKSASLNKADEANDDYSTLFETALENPDDPSLAKSGTLSSVKSSEFTKARSHFFSSQIENSESDEEMPPELPKTKPPDIKSELPKLERFGRSETAVPKDLSDSYNVNKANYESNSGLTSNTHSLDSDVYISAKININNQLKAASVQLGKSNDFVTKEIQSTKEESPSLVKTRSRLFEKPTTISKKPLKNTPTVETPLNLFKTSPLRAKFSQSTSNIFTPNNPTSPPVPKSPVQNYNFDRRRSLTEVTSAFTEKLTRPEKKEPASLRANSPIAKRVQSLTSIFQKQSPEKRKSSPLPEKRTTETPLKLSQKYPPIVSTISKPDTALRTTSSENSLNTLLERQLSKKLKTSSSDLTKMAEGEPPKPESPQLQKKPLAIYRPKNQTDISDPTPTKNFSLKSGEMSPTLRSQTKRRESKTILSKERDQEKFVSVSALKNLFENTRSEVNKPLDNPELIIEVDGPKGVKVVTLETVNASIDSDINNFSEHPQVAITEALGNENINQNDEPSNERVTANHYDKPDVTAVDALENIVPFPQEKEEEVDDTEIKDIALDDIQTRSDNSSNSVVDLINVSVSEIIELKHTDKEITSHPDNDEIIDDSEDIPHAIEETTSQSIKSDVIVISDDAIEISDDSIPVIAIPDESIPVIEISDESSTNNKTNKEYPEDLNPFDDDGSGDLATNPPQKSLNPFDEDVEEQEILTASPKPAARKKFSARSEMQHTFNKEDRSLNPFDCEEDDEQLINKKEELPRSPKPAARKIIHPIELENIIESPSASNTISINPNDEFISPHPIGTEQRRQLKVISASHISLNPFLSDDEGEEIEDNSKPVPKPRKSKNTPFTPEPKPRTSGRSVVSSSHGSSTSISSANSSGQTVRKKKPAPRPPAFVSEISESGHSSLTSSPSTSVQHSPRSTPKTRKIRKAPPPPTSTPYLTAAEPSLNFSSICDKESSQENLATLQAENLVNSDEWEKEKIVKDEVNRNRQSQYFSPSSPTLSQKDYTPNKSTYGMWKRKKGPAPSRPVPQRRLIKALPTTEIRRELDVIELQQQGLEKQGVRLEQIIRDRCEGPENNIDDSVPIDVEDLILQLFEVVNEKNELCRKQAELMYLQRQQRLEEEHADVEYQIRCLMLQPEANKTDSDKAREEELINRLVDIVERRNEIIECLEMDRIREAEEDDSICNSLNTYASKRDENVKSEPEILSKKEKKKTKKEKKNKLKNAQIADDIDKDVDESETFYVAPKDKKKKKFALF